MSERSLNELPDLNRSSLWFRRKSERKEAFVSSRFVFLEPGTGFCLFWINKCKLLLTFVYGSVEERRFEGGRHVAWCQRNKQDEKEKKEQCLQCFRNLRNK